MKKSERKSTKETPTRQKVERWGPFDTPTFLGLDPGFASTGYCVLQRQADYLVPLDVGVIETRKGSAPRVSLDDCRRLQEVYTSLHYLLRTGDVFAIGYEVYQPFQGRASGAWKTARVEGAIVSLAMRHDVRLLPFLPLDLKKGIASHLSASKVRVQKAMVDLIPELRVWFREIPKTKREHAADAAGYAFLAWEHERKKAKVEGFA